MFPKRSYVTRPAPLQGTRIRRTSSLFATSGQSSTALTTRPASKFCSSQPNTFGAVEEAVVSLTGSNKNVGGDRFEQNSRDNDFSLNNADSKSCPTAICFRSGCGDVPFMEFFPLERNWKSHANVGPWKPRKKVRISLCKLLGFQGPANPDASQETTPLGRSPPTAPSAARKLSQVGQRDWSSAVSPAERPTPISDALLPSSGESRVVEAWSN